MSNDGRESENHRGHSASMVDVLKGQPAVSKDPEWRHDGLDAYLSPLQNGVEHKARVWQGVWWQTSLALNAPRIRGTCSANIRELKIVPSSVGVSEGVLGTQVRCRGVVDGVVEGVDDRVVQLFCDISGRIDPRELGETRGKLRIVLAGHGCRKYAELTKPLRSSIPSGWVKASKNAV